MYRRLFIPAILAGALAVSAAAPPAWWAARGATNANPANDDAVVNLGQLKHFTSKAVDELNAAVADGAGTELDGLVQAWINAHPDPKDRDAINVGQLKWIAGKIHARLVYLGLEAEVPGWLAVSADDQQLANLGQLKTVFNFDPSSVDSDKDGLSAAQEAIAGTDPANPDTDGDGVSDGDEVKNGTNPLVAEDLDNDGIKEDFEKHFALQFLAATPGAAAWGSYYEGLVDGDLDPDHDYSGEGISASALPAIFGPVPGYWPASGGYLIEPLIRRNAYDWAYYRPANPNSSPPDPGTSSGMYRESVPNDDDTVTEITSRSDFSSGYLESHINDVDFAPMSNPALTAWSVANAQFWSEAKSAFQEGPDQGDPATTRYSGYIIEKKFRIIATRVDHPPLSQTYMKVTLRRPPFGAAGPTEVISVEPVRIEIPKGKLFSGWLEFQAEMLDGKETAVSLVPVDIRAFRPEMVQKSVDLRPADLAKSIISDAEEMSPGARIRVNRDDDDESNGPPAPDSNKTSVPGENDLIRVDISCGGLEPGLKYVLKRNSPKFRVWESREKSVAILNAQDENEITLDGNGEKTVWVEAVEEGNGELELAIKSGTVSIGTAIKLKLDTYKSLLIGITGETFGALDPKGNGMFNVCQRMYLDGYNVAYYDANDIYPTTSEPAYREATYQIMLCSVTSVGVFGHSHGGGCTHDLAKRLDAMRGLLGTFDIHFTGYVDAIEHEGGTFDTDSELRMPPGSLYHWNYYQGNDVLRGMPIVGAAKDLNVNTTVWGAALGHTDIDASTNVQDDLAAEIKSHVNP